MRREEEGWADASRRVAALAEWGAAALGPGLLKGRKVGESSSEASAEEERRTRRGRRSMRLWAGRSESDEDSSELDSITVLAVGRDRTAGCAVFIVVEGRRVLDNGDMERWCSCAFAGRGLVCCIYLDWSCAVVLAEELRLIGGAPARPAGFCTLPSVVRAAESLLADNEEGPCWPPPDTVLTMASPPVLSVPGREDGAADFEAATRRSWVRTWENWRS